MSQSAQALQEAVRAGREAAEAHAVQIRALERDVVTLTERCEKASTVAAEERQILEVERDGLRSKVNNLGLEAQAALELRRALEAGLVELKQKNKALLEEVGLLSQVRAGSHG